MRDEVFGRLTFEGTCKEYVGGVCGGERRVGWMPFGARRRRTRMSARRTDKKEENLEARDNCIPHLRELGIMYLLLFYSFVHLLGNWF